MTHGVLCMGLSQRLGATVSVHAVFQNLSVRFWSQLATGDTPRAANMFWWLRSSDTVSACSATALPPHGVPPRPPPPQFSPVRFTFWDSVEAYLKHYKQIKIYDKPRIFLLLPAASHRCRLWQRISKKWNIWNRQMVAWSYNFITLKPLKSETFLFPPCRSWAKAEGRKSIFLVSCAVSEFLLSIRPHLLRGLSRTSQHPAGWSLLKIIFVKMFFWERQPPALSAASPAFHKDGIVPCLKHWKQEQIWQQLDSKEQLEKTR